MLKYLNKKLKNVSAHSDLVQMWVEVDHPWLELEEVVQFAQIFIVQDYLIELTLKGLVSSMRESKWSKIRKMISLIKLEIMWGEMKPTNQL